MAPLIDENIIKLIFLLSGSHDVGMGFTPIAHGASRREPAASKVASNGGAQGDVFSTTTGELGNADSAANRLAIASMHFSVLAAIAEFTSIAKKDMFKDAKDTVKDQGEAGHKP